MDSTSTKVKARLLPRDVTDIMVVLFVALPLQFVPVFIAPSVAGFFIARAIGCGFVASFACAFAIFHLIYLTWLGFTVWSLRLSAGGIRFVRLLGKPRFLRWEEITEIAEAPRREVVVRAWLAPRFPTREMTPSLSALRHFRIRWGTDYCYYPPDDAESFLQLLDKFRSRSAA